MCPLRNGNLIKIMVKTKWRMEIVTATTAVCVFADISIDNSKQNNVPIYSRYNRE